MVINVCFGYKYKMYGAMNKRHRCCSVMASPNTCGYLKRRMKFLVVVAAALAVASAASLSLEDLEFHAWKLKFGKSYSSPVEESQRRSSWISNRKLVLVHNMLADQGIKSYRLGMTYFADMTGSLEGQHYRKTNKLVSLSEQQLVDCSGKFGNMGCMGGLMDQAFEYIKSLAPGGLDTEDSYAYHAEDKKCHYKPDSLGATCTGYVDMTSGDESALQQAVATVGPVSVAIDAAHSSFQLYKSGVYDEPDCSSDQLDHGVLAVGYGTSDDGQDYWLVKNSWGLDWGDKGYIMMSRNKHNQCGIATASSYPLV
ncbi:procathepsin L isoform X3 [Salmo salar]|uniref:Procathepsin L isoform X3 n=1 Tax=Salmo salar TaxID=8030 RepID=A0ABM3F7N9_SALSA|nr:procathepsin L isoform X3 [Salmo salar]